MFVDQHDEAGLRHQQFGKVQKQIQNAGQARQRSDNRGYDRRCQASPYCFSDTFPLQYLGEAFAGQAQRNDGEIRDLHEPRNSQPIPDDQRYEEQRGRNAEHDGDARVVVVGAQEGAQEDDECQHDDEEGRADRDTNDVEGDREQDGSEKPQHLNTKGQSEDDYHQRAGRHEQYIFDDRPKMVRQVREGKVARQK